MFHHDPMHTGNTDSNGPSTNQTLWSYTALGPVYSSPCVANGVVYVGSLDHSVYALNALSGAKIWSYATSQEVYSSPCVANGIVYIGSYDSSLYALDATTGVQIWNYTTGNAILTSPCVANGVVYFGSMDGSMYALNALTGAKIWNYTTDNIVWSSPCVANGVIYFGAAFSLYALDATTGTQLWNYTTGNNVWSSPCVSGGIVYFGSYDGSVYALNATSGSIIWSYLTWHDIFSSPCVANGILYVGTGDGNVYALNATTGEKIWNYITSDIVNSSPCAVSNGIVFFGSDDGNVYALDAATGDKIWSYETTVGRVFSSPCAVNDILYIGANDGTSGAVYAFNSNLFNLTMLTVGEGSVLPGNSSHLSGSLVDLKAIAAAGWIFSGWSGDATGTVNTTITMNADKTVTATFVPVEKYQFIIKWSNGGEPRRIAIDSAGYLYVTDSANSRVLKYSNNGELIDQWSDELSNPWGIDLDAYGNIYVVDTGHNRIVKFSSNGTVLTTWGTYGTGDGQFNTPEGIALDSSGNVFVADQTNRRIQKFTSDGTFITKWGSSGSGPGEFSWPRGVAVDASGNVWVADTDNNRIQKFTNDGTYILTYGVHGTANGEFYHPLDIDFDSSGNIYIIEGDSVHTTYGSNRIQKFTSNLAFITSWNGSETGLEFYNCFGLAIDPDGNVFAADTGNNRIVEYSLHQHYALTMFAPTQSCVSPGNRTYIEGSNVLLRALNLDGWSFSGWSGDASGTTNPTLIVMDSNKSVTANYLQNTYRINASVVGQGTIQRNASEPYQLGDVVNLTALPQAGWSFAGWSGDLSGTSNPATLTMDANKSVTATFTQLSQDSYTLTINTIGQGAVSRNASQPYTQNQAVELNATAAAGYQFAGWSGDLVGQTNPATIIMDQNKTVTATFTQTGTYTVTFTQTGLPQGTSWSVMLNGKTQTSTQQSITFTNVARGFYVWRVQSPMPNDSDTRYKADSTIGLLSVPAQTSKTISYTTQYKLTINVEGLPAYTFAKVYLANRLSGVTSASPLEVWLNEGASTGTIGVDSTISGLTSRSIFSNWSDGVTDNPRASIVMNAPADFTANYTSQVKVTFFFIGVPASYSGNVLNVDGANYTYTRTPIVFWWDTDSNHSYQYYSPLNVSSQNQVFWRYTFGLSSQQQDTLTMTRAGTIIGYYR